MDSHDHYTPNPNAGQDPQVKPGSVKSAKGGRKARAKPVAQDQRLAKEVLSLIRTHWRCVFGQFRTFERFIAVMLALVVATGRKTVSASILHRGRGRLNWRPDYRLFEAAPWDPVGLFFGALKAALPFLPDSGPIILALDDTGLPKEGRFMTFARWIHNALAPKWQVTAIMWAISMLHACLILPANKSRRATSISIGFEPIPAPPKREKQAADQTVEPPKKTGRPRKVALPPELDGLTDSEIKTPPTATQLAVSMIVRIRGWLDQLGLAHRPLWVIVDNAYANNTVISGLPARTELIGRARKQARLCKPYEGPDPRRVYGAFALTPKEVGEDPSFEVTHHRCFYSGEKRPIGVRDVCPVLWPNGTKARRLRLLVLEPVKTGRKAKKKGKETSKQSYARPGYLLTTDLHSPSDDLVQAYLWRWEIEVLHKSLKDGLGLGEGQVRIEKAVSRLHAAVVALYALITIATLKVTDGTRDGGYAELPLWRENWRKWRAKEREQDEDPEKRHPPEYRPSVYDNVQRLRTELASGDFGLGA